MRRTSSVLIAVLGALAVTSVTACSDAPTASRHVAEPAVARQADTVRVPQASIVARVELDATGLVLTEGSERRVVATPRDADGRPLDRAVAWASSDPLVVSVSTDGVLTALHPGAATITATSEGSVVTLYVRVTGAYASDAIRDRGDATYIGRHAPPPRAPRPADT